MHPNTDSGFETSRQFVLIGGAIPKPEVSRPQLGVRFDKPDDSGKCFWQTVFPDGNNPMRVISAFITGVCNATGEEPPDFDSDDPEYLIDVGYDIIQKLIGEKIEVYVTHRENSDGVVRPEIGRFFTKPGTADIGVKKPKKAKKPEPETPVNDGKPFDDPIGLDPKDAFDLPPISEPKVEPEPDPDPEVNPAAKEFHLCQILVGYFNDIMRDTWRFTSNDKNASKADFFNHKHYIIATIERIETALNIEEPKNDGPK